MKFWYSTEYKIFLTEPIGYYDNKYIYCHEVEIYPNSCVYCYSDGYHSGDDVFQDDNKIKNIAHRLNKDIQYFINKGYIVRKILEPEKNYNFHEFKVKEINYKLKINNPYEGLYIMEICMMCSKFTLDYELQRKKMSPLREELTAYLLDPDRIEKASAKI